MHQAYAQNPQSNHPTGYKTEWPFPSSLLSPFTVTYEENLTTPYK